MVVIGLFTSPGVLNEPDYVNKKLFHWIHSSGATCKTIDYNTEALNNQLDKVDGLVMGGGAVESKNHTKEQREKLFQTYAAAFSYANTLNKMAKISFPIFTICLGCEMMMLIKNQSPDFKLLDKVEVDGKRKLSFGVDSELKRAFPTKMLDSMATTNCVVQHHFMGVKIGSPLYNSFNEIGLVVLGTDTSPQGVYVNMVKYVGLPYYGIMWHPEKAWNELSKKVALQLSKFLKLECKCRTHFCLNDSSSMLHVRKTVGRQVSLLRKHSSTRKRSKRRRASS